MVLLTFLTSRRRQSDLVRPTEGNRPMIPACLRPQRRAASCHVDDWVTVGQGDSDGETRDTIRKSTLGPIDALLSGE
jgi:hypothetical protein